MGFTSYEDAYCFFGAEIQFPKERIEVIRRFLCWKEEFSKKISPSQLEKETRLPREIRTKMINESISSVEDLREEKYFPIAYAEEPLDKEWTVEKAEEELKRELTEAEKKLYGIDDILSLFLNDSRPFELLQDTIDAILGAPASEHGIKVFSFEQWGSKSLPEQIFLLYSPSFLEAGFSSRGGPTGPYGVWPYEMKAFDQEAVAANLSQVIRTLHLPMNPHPKKKVISIDPSNPLGKESDKIQKGFEPSPPLDSEGFIGWRLVGIYGCHS